LRRMDFAMDRTLDELTGSGSVATAASIADFRAAMVSGEKDALAKSFTIRAVANHFQTVGLCPSGQSAEVDARAKAWIAQCRATCRQSQRKSHRYEYGQFGFRCDKS